MADETKIRDIKGDGQAEIFHVNAGDPIRKTIDYLSDRRIGLTHVIDSTGELAGVISERDVIRAIYEHGGDALDMPTDMFMVRNVVTCSADDRVVDVAKMMAEHHFRHLPIVDGDYLSGMISARDLVKYFAEREP